MNDPRALRANISGHGRLQALPWSLPLLAALLAAAAPAAAQSADPAFSSFIPFGQLQAQLDGEVLEDARLFFAQRPGAYLLRSAKLEQPLLINVRSQQVQRLNAYAIFDRVNGTVGLQTGAVVATLGPFQVEGARLTATFDGERQLVLSPNPDLLGARTAAELVAHDPSYGYRAGLYPPSGKAVDELRKEQRKVTVKVYFGSWCSACSRVVPWLVAVEKALAGSNVAFTYYGLPHTLDDPAVHEAGIKGVPTAVVSAGGVELGRRDSTGLGIPEQALLEILAGD